MSEFLILRISSCASQIKSSVSSSFWSVHLFGENLISFVNGCFCSHTPKRIEILSVDGQACRHLEGSQSANPACMFYVYLPTFPPCSFYIYLSTCQSSLLFSLLYRTLFLVFWKISAFVFWMRVSKEPEDFNVSLFPNGIVAYKWISPAERYAVVPDETLGSIAPQLHQVTHVDITQLSISFLLPQTPNNTLPFYQSFVFISLKGFF